jgi:AmmeMemoRadiSam system protein A
MHPIVRLAKKAVEEYARTGRAPSPEGLPEEFMNQSAGVFVSIKKKGGLRGCIGTFLPTTENLAEETVKNALSASTSDPRFPPVSEDELEELDYSVDVLTSPEPVKGPEDLDPKRYGIIVTKGFRRGLLLPDLDGVDTVDEQLRIAMMKAGMDPSEDDVIIERFEVKRYR